MAEETPVPRGLNMSLDDLIKEDQKKKPNKAGRGGQQQGRGRGRGRGQYQDRHQNNFNNQQNQRPFRGWRGGGDFSRGGRGGGRGQNWRPQHFAPQAQPSYDLGYQQDSFQPQHEHMRIIVDNDDFFPQVQPPVQQYDPLLKRKQWQRCEIDEETGDVVVIFKNYEIIRVTPNGDVILDSQGKQSPLLLASLNDALNLIGIKIVEMGGQWSVSDGKMLTRFIDNVVLPSKGATTAHRGQTLLAAFRDPSGKAAAAATAASTAAAAAAGLLPNGTSRPQFPGARGGMAASQQEALAMQGLPMPWNMGMTYSSNGVTMPTSANAARSMPSQQQYTSRPEAGPSRTDEDDYNQAEPVQARLGKRTASQRMDGDQQQQHRHRHEQQTMDHAPSSSWAGHLQRSSSQQM